MMYPKCLSPVLMAVSMQISFLQTTRWFSLLAIVCGMVIGSAPLSGQTEEAVVRGKIAYDKSRVESWDGNKLFVPYREIQAKLRQRVIPPDPPLPRDFKNWKPEQRLDWEKKFLETDAGKKYLAERIKFIEAAHSFDIKFENDGTFVIYDVPVGVYGIQGRVDKEIGGTTYGFEVFGQIEVLKGVDELALEPMRVEVTPLMKRKQAAPPISVKTHDNKATLTLDNYKENYLFVNFWTSASPTAVQEQMMVQEMYLALKEGNVPVKLLSINIDSDRKKALQYIVSNRLREGSHGFTDGVEHRTIFDYGVRSFPSFWILDKDDSILMTQYEVAQAMRVKPDMITIVTDRIEGKDEPTPAEAPTPDESETSTPAEEKKEDAEAKEL